jgi:hypothetical protein
LPLEFLHWLIARLSPMQKTSGYGIGTSGRLGWSISAGFRGLCRLGFLHGRDFDRPDAAAWPRLTPERGTPSRPSRLE